MAEYKRFYVYVCNVCDEQAHWHYPTNGGPPYVGCERGHADARRLEFDLDSDAMKILLRHEGVRSDA